MEIIVNDPNIVYTHCDNCGIILYEKSITIQLNYMKAFLCVKCAQELEEKITSLKGDNGMIVMEKPRLHANDPRIKLQATYNHIFFNRKLRDVIMERKYITVQLGIDVMEKHIVLYFDNNGNYPRNVRVQNGPRKGDAVELLSSADIIHSVKHSNALLCERHNGYSGWLNLVKDENDVMVFSYEDEIDKV